MIEVLLIAAAAWLIWLFGVIPTTVGLVKRHPIISVFVVLIVLMMATQAYH